MIDKIMSIMNEIEYGYIDVHDNKYFDDYTKFAEIYKLQSPEEVIKNKIGVCWDQVELERKLFDENNIKFKTYFMVNYDNDKSPTHTFLLYEQDNKCYWFEHSWEKYRGIHEYINIHEALIDIKNKFFEDLEEDNIYIYGYTKPTYGIGVESFFHHCEKGNGIVL